MASVFFDRAVSYTLGKLNRQQLQLKKEQLQAIHYVYEGKDVFLWLPTGFGTEEHYGGIAIVITLT